MDLETQTSPPVQRSYRLLVAGVALLIFLLYLGVMSLVSEPGLPLDDSWIHQTYARNLAWSGRWEYTSGIASAGSTAPLWTILLTAGYLLNLPYLPWTYFLGWLCLVWIGWAGMSFWRTLWPEWAPKSWLAGLALVLSWPLVWAAGSGMETLLFSALTLQVLLFYSQYLLGWKQNGVDEYQPSKSPNFSLARLGFMAGLAILVRPDGLWLLLLVGAGLLLVERQHKDRLRRMGIFLAAAVLPLLPYFALNLATGDHLWPNTLYAKQAEYASLWDSPLLLRFGQLLLFSLGGPAEGWRGMSAAHLLLLPGLLIAAWSALSQDWSERRALYTLPLVWAAGHVFLYAWRLPVTYQHGRYLLPVFSLWVLYGLVGWLRLLDAVADRFRLGQRFEFVWRAVTGLTFAVIVGVFLLLGSQAYGQDVAFINGEMVSVARWLQGNTSPDALVAAHDIGALGYFAERPLLDLAGLLSPDVVPLLRDQGALSDYVKQRGADYLVTAPGWTYRSLTVADDTFLVYETGFVWTEQQGLNSMAVYRLHSP